MASLHEYLGRTAKIYTHPRTYARASDFKDGKLYPFKLIDVEPAVTFPDGNVKPVIVVDWSRSPGARDSMDPPRSIHLCKQSLHQLYMIARLSPTDDMELLVDRCFSAYLDPTVSYKDMSVGGIRFLP